MSSIMDPTTSDDRSEFCFFDLETTFPQPPNQGRVILEFGAILVCPRRLVELNNKNYSSLVRPDYPSSISLDFARSKGITRDAILAAPSFSEIADKVYDFLHGRIWVGHNIKEFDCVIVREAFEKIGRTPPEHKGIIDSLMWLSKRFGRRAGNLKMSTLANYFEIGRQTHRSLDDVRINLEVIRHCAAVLHLESSLPEMLTADGAVSQRPTSNSNNIISLLEASDPVDQPYPFDMGLPRNEIITEALQPAVTMEEIPELEPPEMSPATAIAEGCSDYAGFLKPDEVSITSISAISLIPYYLGTWYHVKLLHKDVAFQLYCPCLRVRHGILPKYFDQVGRPRLSFVVDASPRLCLVLDRCYAVAKKISEDYGSKSKWKPVVFGDSRYTHVRLHIPTKVNGDIDTEIHQKDCYGTVQKLVFSYFEAAELGNLFRAGISVDAFFSLDTYDNQQGAGIHLVAKKLVLHSD